MSHIWWTASYCSVLTHKISCIFCPVVVYCIMSASFPPFPLNQNEPWVTFLNCVTSPMHMHMSYHISHVSQFTCNHICQGFCMQSTSLMNSLVSASRTVTHKSITLCYMDSLWFLVLGSILVCWMVQCLRVGRLEMSHNVSQVSHNVT